jgi:hypothetical protein
MYKDSEGRTYTFFGWLHPKGTVAEDGYALFVNSRNGKLYVKGLEYLTREA